MITVLLMLAALCAAETVPLLLLGAIPDRWFGRPIMQGAAGRKLLVVQSRLHLLWHASHSHDSWPDARSDGTALLCSCGDRHVIALREVIDARRAAGLDA